MAYTPSRASVRKGHQLEGIRAIERDVVGNALTVHLKED
jgi:hypothetical protein